VKSVNPPNWSLVPINDLEDLLGLAMGPPSGGWELCLGEGVGGEGWSSREDGFEVEDGVEEAEGSLVLEGVEDLEEALPLVGSLALY